MRTLINLILAFFVIGTLAHMAARSPQASGVINTVKSAVSESGVERFNYSGATGAVYDGIEAVRRTVPKLIDKLPSATR